MEFRQQVKIYASPMFGQANYNGASNVDFGFGNEGKNLLSLQVTFYNASNSPAAPSTAEVWLIGSNDGNFGTTKPLDWVFGTQANGDVVDATAGPYIYGQVNWGTLSWGSDATYAVITIVAKSAKDNN